MDTGKTAVENIAKRHIESIKSRGEKGCSVVVALMIFEEMEKNNPNVLEILRTEYSLIEVLARVMKEEIERMEEEEK